MPEQRTRINFKSAYRNLLVEALKASGEHIIRDPLIFPVGSQNVRRPIAVIYRDYISFLSENDMALREGNYHSTLEYRIQRIISEF